MLQTSSGTADEEGRVAGEASGNFRITTRSAAGHPVHEPSGSAVFSPQLGYRLGG